MLVSIIIPTYNRAATIGAAVQSSLSQTYRNIEVIVVDDGSNDSTHGVLGEFGARIRVIKQANAGPSAARNHGVRESCGEIVSFLDSDDIWLPDKIERQVKLMTAIGESMCCCVCNAEVRGLCGELVGDSFGIAGLKVDTAEGEWLNPSEVLATSFLLFNQVVAVRREAFQSVGGFNEGLRILEDYELALKLSSIGTWGVIKDPLVVKKNDTEGIGVEFSKNHIKHMEACVDVIAGFLKADKRMNSTARTLLQRSLGELRIGLRAERLNFDGRMLGRFSGKGLGFLLRLHKAARRRGPSWPRPSIRKI